jgi:hypothetical protein
MGLRAITTVIRWQNGMVTVFDEEGEQIPMYQGRYDEHREAILRDAPPSALFCYGHWRDNRSHWPVPRQEW